MGRSYGALNVCFRPLATFSTDAGSATERQVCKLSRMVNSVVERYSKGAILLHWLLALLLAGEIALGFTMPRDASGFALYQLHKSIGITILFLTIIRLGWRVTHRRPLKVEQGLNGVLASAVHVSFYFFMVAAPLTGWAIVSSAPMNVPTLVFGVVPWPHLPLPQSTNTTFEGLHEALAFLGIGLFVLHVAGALRHHFLLRDDLLKSISLSGLAGETLTMLVAVLALGVLVSLNVLMGAGENGREIRIEASSEPEQMSAGVVPGAREAPRTEGGIPEGGKQGPGKVIEPTAPTASEAGATAGSPSSWVIEPGGSLRFTVDNGGTALNGTFRSWGGTIRMDPDDPKTAIILIDIDLVSATLGDATLDQMLLGEAFFGVASNRSATFRSNSVERMTGNNYRAKGTLLLKGISRAQSVAFVLSRINDRRVRVTGSAMVNRKSHSVGTGPEAENLAVNVRVDFSFEATR